MTCYILSLLFVFIVMFFSCPAKVVSREMIELPCGREFLDQPTTAKGDVFVTAYFDSNSAIHLVRVVDMSRLHGKNEIRDWL